MRVHYSTHPEVEHDLAQVVGVPAHPVQPAGHRDLPPVRPLRRELLLVRHGFEQQPCERPFAQAHRAQPKINTTIQHRSAVQHPEPRQVAGRHGETELEGSRKRGRVRRDTNDESSRRTRSREPDPGPANRGRGRTGGDLDLGCNGERQHVERLGKGDDCDDHGPSAGVHAIGLVLGDRAGAGGVGREGREQR